MVAFMVRSGSRQKKDARGGTARGRCRRTEGGDRRKRRRRERGRQAKGGGGVNEIQIERGVESFARVNDIIISRSSFIPKSW